jgi:23S rRNA (guanine745-N1)-methyltransferase
LRISQSSRALSDHLGSVLTCPIDGSALASADGAAVKCAQGHSFDRAREGYFNLLLVQHKASLDPGDSKAMVAARRRILDAHCYAPIADRLVARVAGLDPAPATILDAGCGEGTYLNALAHGLPSAPLLLGIDISKWAVQAAAKRTTAAFWAVATNRHLPFAQSSIDLIVSLFGFPVWSEFARVQCSGGHVLLVDPGPEHLIELRSIIYPEVTRASPPSLAAAQAAGYMLIDEQRLSFPMALTSPEQIADLLAMTPHDHRAPLAGRAALATHSSLALTGEVVFRLLRR